MTDVEGENPGTESEADYNDPAVLEKIMKTITSCQKGLSECQRTLTSQEQTFQELQTCQDDLGVLKQKSEQSVSRQERLQKQVDTFKDSNNNCERDLAMAKDLSDQLQRKYDKLKILYDRIVPQLASCTEDLRQCKATLSTRTKQFFTGITTDVDVRNVKRNLAESKQNVDSLTADNQNLKKRLDILRADNQQLGTVITILKTAIDEQLNWIKELRVAYTEMESERAGK